MPSSPARISAVDRGRPPARRCAPAPSAAAAASSAQLGALAARRRALLELARLLAALGAVPVGRGHEQQRRGPRGRRPSRRRAGARRSFRARRRERARSRAGADIGRPVRSVWRPGGESRSSRMATAAAGDDARAPRQAEPERPARGRRPVGRSTTRISTSSRPNSPTSVTSADSAIGTAGTRCEAVITSRQTPDAATRASSDVDRGERLPAAGVLAPAPYQGRNSDTSSATPGGGRDPLARAQPSQIHAPGRVRRARGRAPSRGRRRRRPRR